MSEENQNRNNRSRNNNNRNRNRNRNRNNNGGQRNRNGGNNRGGDSASQQRNQLQPTRNRRGPKPKPLTFWQKVLKAIGLYKDPNEKPAQSKKQDQKGNQPNQKNGRVAGGGRVEGKDGNKAKKKQTRRREETPPTVVSSPRIYVGNLSYDASEHDLEELFKGIGAVRSVELVYNRHTHKSKGYGFISMGNIEEAERAVEVLHDQPFMGRKMIVNGARSKGPADGDSEGRPRRSNNNNRKSENAAPKQQNNDEIPADEEVHSLMPKED